MPVLFMLAANRTNTTLPGPVDSVTREVVTLLIGAAISLSNAFSLAVFCRTLHRHPTVLWFLSLCCSDLLFGLCCLVHLPALLVLGRPFPPITYPTVLLATVTANISPCSLAVLSADRWAAVEFPRGYLQHLAGPGPHRALCAGLWGYFAVGAVICVTCMPVVFVHLPAINSTFLATWSTWYSDWFFALPVPLASGVLLVTQLRLGYLAGKWKYQRLLRRKRSASLLLKLQAAHPHITIISHRSRLTTGTGSSSAESTLVVALTDAEREHGEARAWVYTAGEGTPAGKGALSGMRTMWQLRRTVVVVSANVLIYLLSQLPMFIVLRLEPSPGPGPYRVLLQLATYLTIASHLWPPFITYSTSLLYRQQAHQLLASVLLHRRNNT
ncbi:uncharacterized protein LOC129587983 [Paramacrobiotus metropolitanus]|uniref:uncharacterized protein LOC129587983 n=1 Tax=Paramacrobiotus metropolitanus TaxID=2943436 RepID=UPI0024455F36|nr:uncharacterized protein LOC129587983 [Paramacrobiotus metropolitanus]